MTGLDANRVGARLRLRIDEGRRRPNPFPIGVVGVRRVPEPRDDVRFERFVKAAENPVAKGRFHLVAAERFDEHLERLVVEPSGREVVFVRRAGRLVARKPQRVTDLRGARRDERVGARRRLRGRERLHFFARREADKLAVRRFVRRENRIVVRRARVVRELVRNEKAVVVSVTVLRLDRRENLRRDFRRLDDRRRILAELLQIRKNRREPRNAARLAGEVFPKRVKNVVRREKLKARLVVIARLELRQVVNAIADRFAERVEENAVLARSRRRFAVRVADSLRVDQDGAEPVAAARIRSERDERFAVDDDRANRGAEKGGETRFGREPLPTELDVAGQVVVDRALEVGVPTAKFQSRAGSDDVKPEKSSDTGGARIV